MFLRNCVKSDLAPEQWKLSQTPADIDWNLMEHPIKHYLCWIFIFFTIILCRTALFDEMMQAAPWKEVSVERLRPLKIKKSYI